jgi:hypothetical protein
MSLLRPDYLNGPIHVSFVEVANSRGNHVRVLEKPIKPAGAHPADTDKTNANAVACRDAGQGAARCCCERRIEEKCSPARIPSVSHRFSAYATRIQLANRADGN